MDLIEHTGRQKAPLCSPMKYGLACEFLMFGIFHIVFIIPPRLPLLHGRISDVGRVRDISALSAH